MAWGGDINPYIKGVGKCSYAGDSRLHPHQNFVDLAEIPLCPSVLTLIVVSITD